MLERIIFVIIGLGIINSSYLFYETLSKKNQYACSVDTCGIVQTSKYAYFLGIPVAFWGLIWFITIFFLRPYLTKNKYIYYFYLLLLVFGFLFAGYLQIISIFVLKTICKFCFLNFVIITLVLIIEIFIFYQRYKGKTKY